MVLMPVWMVLAFIAHPTAGSPTKNISELAASMLITGLSQWIFILLVLGSLATYKFDMNTLSHLLESKVDRRSAS